MPELRLSFLTRRGDFLEVIVMSKGFVITVDNEDLCGFLCKNWKCFRVGFSSFLSLSSLTSMSVRPTERLEKIMM